METYLAYLTIFIALTTAALLAQAAILVLTYLRLKRLDEETQSLRRQVREQLGPILRNVEDTSITVREQSRVIFDDLSALSRDARRQMDKFDRLSDEMADRVRLQIIRLDELLSLALANLEQAGAAVKQNVVEPVREATAVLRGVKAAIDFLSTRRNRVQGRSRRTEEELFI